MLRFLRTPFLSPEPAVGGTPPAPAPPAVAPLRPEVRASDFVTRMIATHGSVDNALTQTALRLFKSEDDLQVAERNRIPEGAVVIPQAEVAAFNALRALGTPAEIQAKVKREGELSAADEARTAATAYREFATAAGLDPDGFAAHAGAAGLETEIRATNVSVVEGGKTKTVSKPMPYVRVKGDAKAPFVAAADYLAKLPAHAQRAVAATAAAPTTAPTTAAAPVTQYPRQSATVSEAPVGNRVQAFADKLADRGKARVNPITSRAATVSQPGVPSLTPAP